MYGTGGLGTWMFSQTMIPWRSIAIFSATVILERMHTLSSRSNVSAVSCNVICNIEHPKVCQCSSRRHPWSAHGCSITVNKDFSLTTHLARKELYEFGTVQNCFSCVVINLAPIKTLQVSKAAEYKLGNDTRHFFLHPQKYLFFLLIFQASHRIGRMTVSHDWHFKFWQHRNVTF